MSNERDETRELQQAIRERPSRYKNVVPVGYYRSDIDELCEMLDSLREALGASRERERRLEAAIESAIIGLQTLALTDQLNSQRRAAASLSECRAVADVVRVLCEALAPKGEG